jgi:predicted  nucleic acid-binding Zn-ribbon protein
MQIKDELQTIIDTLSKTSGSFDDYAKQVENIIKLLTKCKNTETEVESLKQKNKLLTEEKTKINNDKLAAETKLKECNDVRNKTDYVKMKEDFADAISNKESQILELKNENRKLKSDVKDATAKSVEMVPSSKDKSTNIPQLPSDFKKKCETPAGQNEMLALADKYIKMKTSDSEIDKIYKTLGFYIKEKCYNSSTKVGGKSRKSRKQRKSKQTRRIYI